MPSVVQWALKGGSMNGLLAIWPTHGAIQISGRVHSLPLHVLRVEHHELAVKAAAHATQNFKRFGCLHAANDSHQGSQDAHAGAASFFKTLGGRKDAGVAR